VLQIDAQSLSNVLPSILNLESHLQQHGSNKQLTMSMLRDFHCRFESILIPDSPLFNSLPAAACLLDPTLAPVMLLPEFGALLNAAKLYILSQDGGPPASTVTEVAEPVEGTRPTAVSRFAFLAARMQNTTATLSMS